MTCTLVVLAHPGTRSFNANWAEATREACAGLGHNVLFSDLCGTRFDAVEAGHHYDFDSEDGEFDALKTHEKSVAQGCIPQDVAAEMGKLRKADTAVFHFPIWWFAPPAVLKGWFDRVLVHGALHSVDQRFDTGLFRGKKALMCVTTGSDENESAYNGKEGDIQMLLWPVAQTLRYLGFTVLEPEVVHGVHGYHKGAARDELEDRLKTAIDTQPDLIAGLETRKKWRFNDDDDFDENGRLKPDRPSHSHFIRHTK